MKLVRYVVVAVLAAALILQYNPFGWGQRLFFGQQPPYHWVLLPLGPGFTGDINEEYVGTNGRTCARVYRFTHIGMGDTYTVYGFGFSDHAAATQEQAEAAAEWECR